MRVCVLPFSFIKAKKTSSAYIIEQKIPFRMVVFSTVQLIYNLRNLNLKNVNFESKSSKIGEKVVGFSKNSFGHPRGDMDLKPFRGARYGSGLLALAS